MCPAHLLRHPGRGLSEAWRLTAQGRKPGTAYSAGSLRLLGVILMTKLCPGVLRPVPRAFHLEAPRGRLSGLCPRPAPPPQGPTYPAHLHQFGDHGDTGTVFLPYHAPGSHRPFQALALGSREGLSLRPGLHPRPNTHAPLVGQEGPQAPVGASCSPHTPPSTADSCLLGPWGLVLSRRACLERPGHPEQNPGGRAGGPWHKPQEGWTDRQWRG